MSFGVFQSTLSEYTEIAADFPLATARAVQDFDAPSA